MMISPESYYEFELKGKTEEEIMKSIRGLKREMGRLKNIMEHPDYANGPIIHPSESTQLYWTREYLERAKSALKESGGIYMPSEAELKNQSFEDSISLINKVIFSIGGFFCGFEKMTISIDKSHLYVGIHHSLKPSADSKDENDFQLTKEEFLEGIHELHIGEWRRNYSPNRFGYYILDGTQWELEIYFSNGKKPLKAYGSNSYPYNFDEFLELLGLNANIEEDVEE